MLAPVVLFVYKRYEHTKKVLEALNRNALVTESELYILPMVQDPKRLGRCSQDTGSRYKLLRSFSI